MNPTKKCTKCHETKPLDEFYKDNRRKNGRQSKCKECAKKYKEEHKKEASIQNKIWYEKTGRKKRGSKSMYENKSCAQYIGIVIAERLVRHLFKDVEVMPNGFPGYDFICNKGKKINVKAASITLTPSKYPRWAFNINHNTTADFFILVAFDNRTDLNPLHLWMIPGNKINKQLKASIALSTVHKWDKWKKDIEDAQVCCNEMKIK